MDSVDSQSLSVESLNTFLSKGETKSTVKKEPSRVKSEKVKSENFGFDEDDDKISSLAPFEAGLSEDVNDRLTSLENYLADSTIKAAKIFQDLKRKVGAAGITTSVIDLRTNDILSDVGVRAKVDLPADCSSKSVWENIGELFGLSANLQEASEDLKKEPVQQASQEVSRALEHSEKAWRMDFVGASYFQKFLYDLGRQLKINRRAVLDLKEKSLEQFKERLERLESGAKREISLTSGEFGMLGDGLDREESSAELTRLSERLDMAVTELNQLKSDSHDCNVVKTEMLDLKKEVSILQADRDDTAFKFRALGWRNLNDVREFIQKNPEAANFGSFADPYVFLARVQDQISRELNPL